MYYDFLVKIPAEKGKIFERTIKGVTLIMNMAGCIIRIKNITFPREPG